MNATFQKRYAIETQHGRLQGLECYSPKLCYAFGPSHLLRSEDGGRNWKDLYWASPLHVGMNPQHVAFFSADEGLLVVKKGPPELIYFRSHDGGQSWRQARRLSEGGYVWTSLSAVRGSGKAWTFVKQRGGNAFIEKFDAKEDRWTRTSIAIPGYPHQIMFVNESRGWILERWDKKTWIEESPRVRRTTTVLHHTEDGGSTWNIVCKKEGAGLKVTATDVGSLIMAGEDGIFSSGDCGLTWTQVMRKPRVPLHDIQFLGKVGVAIGTEGIIGSLKDVLMMVSKDGGESWQEIKLPAADSYVSAGMTTWSSGVVTSDTTLYTFELP